MKIKLITLLFISLGFFKSAHALPDSSSANGESYGIGIGGTVYKTWGFNYRHYFPSNLGVTANIGGWLTRSSGHLGIASGVLYTFAHHYFRDSELSSSSLRVYGIGYLAGIFRKDYIDYKDNTSGQKALMFDLGFGVGPGAEFFFTKKFSIHLELPWMTFFTFAPGSFHFKNSYPHIGGGISYYF